jgi:hypothetical protein
MSKRALLLSVFTLAACSNSVGATGSTGSGGAGGAGGGPVSPQSFTVTYDPITVMPGEEHTQCIVKRLNNPTAVHVGTIHNVLGQGSHHLIVYKTNDTMEQTTPFDCQPFTDLLHPEKGTPLMITQKKDDTLTLPKGVAFGIDANQMVRLEMHYINPTSSPLQVTATTTFTPMNEADFQNEAGFLFMGDPDINIPAHGTQTLGPVYLPQPANLSDVKYFGFTGHEHQWGTNVKVDMTTGKTGADTPVYDVPNWTWNEPKTVYVDPPISVPAGGGFHLTCSWNNMSASTVKFGESANDEMCFFWTYYYPNQGAFVCAHTDKVAGGYDLCCPGNAFCSQLFP